MGVAFTRTASRFCSQKMIDLIEAREVSNEAIKASLR